MSSRTCDMTLNLRGDMSVIEVDQFNRTWIATNPPRTVDVVNESIQSQEVGCSRLSFERSGQWGLVVSDNKAEVFTVNPPFHQEPIEVGPFRQIRWANQPEGCVVVLGEDSLLSLANVENGSQSTFFEAQDAIDFVVGPQAITEQKAAIVLLGKGGNLFLVNPFLPSDFVITKEEFCEILNNNLTQETNSFVPVLFNITEQIPLATDLAWTTEGLFIGTPREIIVLSFPSFPSFNEAPRHVRVIVQARLQLPDFSGFIFSNRLFATTKSNLYQICSDGYAEVGKGRVIGVDGVNRVYLTKEGEFEVFKKDETEAVDEESIMASLMQMSFDELFRKTESLRHRRAHLREREAQLLARKRIAEDEIRKASEEAHQTRKLISDLQNLKEKVARIKMNLLRQTSSDGAVISRLRELEKRTTIYIQDIPKLRGELDEYLELAQKCKDLIECAESMKEDTD